MSEILFLTNTKKKLDLLRDRLIEIFRTLLFPLLHARERERERVKSQRSALLESFETKKSDAKLYIYVIYI